MTEHTLRQELRNLVQHLALFKDKAAELEAENAALKAQLPPAGGTSSNSASAAQVRHCLCLSQVHPHH